MADDRQPPIRTTTPAPDAAGGSSDFGRFVSSSASKSFRQLSRDRNRSTSSRRTAEPTIAEAGTTEPEPPAKQGPIGRRWRDAAGVESALPEDDDHDPSLADTEMEPESSPVPLRARLLDDNGKPRREVIAIAIALLLLLILVIFLATRGGDGDGGNADVTPTGTTTNVLGGATEPDDAGTAIPTSAASATERDTPDRTPDSEPTEDTGEDDGVQVGGDNQRD